LLLLSDDDDEVEEELYPYDEVEVEKEELL